MLDLFEKYAIFGAFWMTIKLTVFSAIGALVIGTVLAVMRVSPIAILRRLGTFYVNTVRNTPLTLILVFCSLGVLYILQINLADPKSSTSIVDNNVRWAIVGLAVYHAAFVCEALRSGVNTVPVGQAEAARSIGLTFTQSLREVILPQAFRGSIAPLGSVLIALTKNTTVASVIGVAEASLLMSEIIENETASLGVFLVFAMGFVILTLPVGMLFTSHVAAPGGEAMSAQNVLFDAPGPRARRRHAILTVVGFVLAAGGVALVLWKFAAQGQLEPSMWTSLFTADVWTAYLIPGLINTLKASAISIVLAIAFGLAFGLGRLSPVRAVRWVCGVVVEFFRSVPVLLMMYFAYRYYSNNGVFTNDVNPLAAVVTGLTLYNGSVIAELVRSGVFGLPKGQAEAGLSIGLTQGQTLRSIQLPQALTAMLPALVGQLVVILKDSALGTAVLYPELLQAAKDIGTAYSNTIAAYILVAVIFILLNYGLTVVAGRVERRLNRRGRGPRRGGPATGVTGAGTVDTPTDGIGGTGVYTGDAASR